MKNSGLLGIGNPRPVCVGTGLVALDVVIGADPHTPRRFWAGGSCGNVLTILSYLGWESHPIARLRDDIAAQELVKDLSRWNVKTDLVSRNGSSHTPIIVETIGEGHDGTPRHRFEWICPNCGSWLPRYGRVLVKDVGGIAERMPAPQVFYFDRVVRSAVELAKTSKRHGALVIFEPSSSKDEKLFVESLQIADIVKYSNQRLGHIEAVTDQVLVPLEIATLGGEGLRYRMAQGCQEDRKWAFLPAIRVSNLRDAAGSGDWCSAGVLHLLGQDGKSGFDASNEDQVRRALNFGQALAAINCYYEGARGAMYNISRRKFNALTRRILMGVGSVEPIEAGDPPSSTSAFGNVCPSCGRDHP